MEGALESNQFDGAHKKKQPAIPSRRRAARMAADDEDPESSVPTNSAGTPKADGPKKSGWGDSPDAHAEPAKEPAGRRRRGQQEAQEEAVVQTATRHGLEDDDGPDAFIPDLEDEAEDMARQVAAAPSLKSSRVQTIDELDEEIDTALPSTSEVGVDLSVLQSYLTPAEYVHEDDTEWKFEHQLQVIASEMQRETDERDSTTLPASSSPVKAKPKPVPVA